MRCIIRLGDWVEAIISFFTLGHGHYLAQWIANKLGYEDCGCDARREWLNNLAGCKQQDIKLN
jgi:hypothetical protein